VSISYTADIFCDGDGCGDWCHGVTQHAKATSHAYTRRNACDAKGWTLNYKGSGCDYCPKCSKNLEKVHGQNGSHPAQ
jgi:hypothetical protein